MALKRKLTADEYESLSDGLKEQYRREGDTFILELASDDTTLKLKEFRDSNIELRRKLEKNEADMARYKDIDPTLYAEAVEAKKKLDALTDKSLLEDGRLEEIVKSRIAPAMAEKEKEIKANRDRADALEKKYARQRQINQAAILEKTAREAVRKLANPRPGAEEDIINRAKATFAFDEEDNLVAPDRFDKESNPLTPDTWAKDLVVNSPHLFESSNGSAAPGGKKGAASGDKSGRVLRNPGNAAMIANLEKIASGQVEVVRDANG